jgi:hypothetical protein
MVTEAEAAPIPYSCIDGAELFVIFMGTSGESKHPAALLNSMINLHSIENLPVI